MTRSPRTHAAGPRRIRCLIALLPVLAVLACGGDETVVLGARMPDPYRFGTPAVISALSVEAKADNPSLTADLLEIYFTASTTPGPGPADVWFARRDDESAQFGAPQRVSEVNSPGIETSPVVSADGLTLWVASDRAGGRGDLDIWVSTRKARTKAWSTPTNVGVLNSMGKDIPRPPGQHQRVMPMASDRETLGYYQIYFSARDEVSTPFQEPTPVSELSFDDQSTVDAFLTDDGLSLFYVTGPEFGPADLYVASRHATSDPFELPVPLTDLNTSHDERDPWLSDDGRLLFFSSDRSGRYEIYVAPVHREALAITDS